MAEQVMEQNTLEGEQNELRTSEVTVLGMFSLREQLQRKMIRKVLGFFLKQTFFVAHLSKLLINYPKLEIVADDVFIKGNNKSRSLKNRKKKKENTSLYNFSAVNTIFQWFKSKLFIHSWLEFFGVFFSSR